MKFLNPKENINLTKTEQNILIYFNNNINKIASMNIEEISEATFTSTTSIIRLSNKLGYSGFKELKNFLKTTSSNHHVTKNHTINDYINVLYQLDSLNQDIKIKNVDKEIMQHDQIVFIGEGESFLIAEMAANLLYQKGYNSKAASCKHIEKLAIIESKADILVIMISYSGETPSLINFAKLIQNKLMIISITEKTNNTLQKFATHKIYLPLLNKNKIDDLQFSFVARMVAIHMITKNIINKNKM